MSAPTFPYDKTLAQLSGSALQAIRVYILNAIVNGETVLTTAQDLITAAKCYSCIPDGLLGAIEVYLLTQIANGGGAGGSSGITCSELDPVDAPTGSCGMHVNTLNQSLWFWDGSTWVALIA
jgi:hypothetical protein